MDTKPGTTKKRNSNKSFPDPLRGYLYTRQTVWLISSRATVRLFIHFICVKDEAFLLRKPQGSPERAKNAPGLKTIIKEYNRSR